MYYHTYFLRIIMSFVCIIFVQGEWSTGRELVFTVFPSGYTYIRIIIPIRAY
jgi:hypothetical protein